MTTSRPLALVTGGTSGLGRGIAEKLAPTHDLALAYGSNSERAAEAVAAIQALAPSCTVRAFARELRVAADAAGLHAEVCESFGRAPLVLVHSAGRLADGLFLQADPDAGLQLVHEHLLVGMALARASLKPMYQARSGRIVMLSSISGAYAKRGQTYYAAAKSGIEGFVRTLALEVAHRGVTVNAISPGLFETPMTRDLAARIEADGEGGIRARVPVGRMGRPDEVGALAAFLCGESAAYITGQTITIDGGRSLGDPRS